MTARGVVVGVILFVLAVWVVFGIVALMKERDGDEEDEG